MLDAVLTGAKGLNLWCAFRGNPPQRRARLYTALVERGLASTVSGALLPTVDPFLYSISFTATQGVPLEALEESALAEIDRVGTAGVTPAETERARRQLKARLVFETDSVTNIAHQLGYFDTVGGAGLLSRLEALHRCGHAGAGLGHRAPTIRRQQPDRWLVPSDRGARVSQPALARGLSPVRAVLDNGVVVIVQENPAAPAVAINATFSAGSALEPERPPGAGVPDRARHRPWRTGPARRRRLPRHWTIAALPCVSR